MNYEQLLRAVFSCFHGQKFNFSDFILHCRVRPEKLLDTKVMKILKKLGSIFGGFKIDFFLGLAGLVLE